VASLTYITGWSPLPFFAFGHHFLTWRLCGTMTSALRRKWYSGCDLVRKALGQLAPSMCALERFVPNCTRTLVVVLVLVVVLPAITVACGATLEPTPEPTKATLPGVEVEGLWYPLWSEPLTLDPQLVTDANSLLVMSQVTEGLFEYRADGSIQPTGATGYEVSDDGLVYTITLRDDAVWSDGEPVIAQHFVDGIIRLLKPETSAEYAWRMYAVEGAEAFSAGKTDDPSTVAITAIDNHTLQITLADPAPYFETLLPFTVFYPARLDVIEEYGNQWTEPGNHVSNGAYLLESWEPEKGLVLVKNPTYWGADSVTIDRITLPIIHESDISLARYEAGELHVSEFPSEEVPRILEDPVLGQELHVLPRPGVYYIGLNTRRSPTDDVNVRKALAAAIDRDSIVKDAIQRPWRPTLTCSTPPRIMGHQPVGTCGWSFDQQRAQQFLADAGYPDGEGFPALQVWYNRADFNRDVIEAVSAMWQENLGIEVELVTMEWAVYLDYLDDCNSSKSELADCEFNAYRMGWVMDYGDPQNQLELVFAPSSVFQYTGWENEYFDELIDLAGAEPDTVTREAYYMEADRILSEDEVAIIPLMGYDRSILVKEGIEFEYPPFGAPAFKYWSLP
jgi:oligopeptide transport system substrate-binding protein